MSGMSGGSMLRTRRKDVNVKPNRKLDRKSSRGMLYENEELRLRTININAEVERGQSDIKKLKRENEQLKREILSLRYEYDKLDKLLRERDNQSSEGTEESDSCCSDCEEKVCKQNDANSVYDENSSNSRAGASGTGSLHVAFNNLMVVPEEATNYEDRTKVLHDANVDTRELNDECDCEECITERKQSETPKNTNINNTVRTQTSNTILPYEAGNDQPTGLFVSPIFPKQELDILINNNNNNIYNTEPSMIAPPIGFVLPNRNLQFNPFEHLPHNQLIPFNSQQQARRFQTGGNVEDLLGDIQSTGTTSKNCLRDAVFMCNTRKVIQQSVTNAVLEDKKPADSNLTETVVKTDPIDGKTYYVTEKNIDLHYDYPRMASIPESPTYCIPSNSEDDFANDTQKQCKTTTTQTVLTTTEINSTVLMIDRQKMNPKNRFAFFCRSQSAPVEPVTDEPIYATVKKLPKKLRLMDVTSLENEVSYKPTENVKTDDVNCENETKVELTKENKDDTTSASSSQLDTTIETKSVTKKKRFSLYFKRRSKITIPKKKKGEPIDKTEDTSDNNETVNEELKQSNERLPLTKTDGEVSKTLCPKHRILKHTDSRESNKSTGSGQDQSTPPNGHANGQHRKHHKCKKRKKSIRSNSSGKHKYSPIRSYSKHDSLQV